MVKPFTGIEARDRRRAARAEVRRLELQVDLEWTTLRIVQPQIKRTQVPLHRELRRAHLRQAAGEIPTIAQGLLIVTTLTAANVFGFHLLGLTYLTWWISSGAFISAFFLFISIMTDLDHHPGLIAQDPMGFYASLFAACSELASAWGVPLARTASDWELDGTPGADHRSFLRWRALDAILTLGFSIAFAFVVGVWILVISPAQYWTNLICGAPARQVLTSSKTVWVKVTPTKQPDGTTGLSTQIVTAPRSEAPPVGARMTPLISKPVSLTAAVSAAFLLVLKFFN